VVADFLQGLPLAEQVAAHILRKQAQRLGERVFVVCGNERITYAEADRRADRVAAAFHSLGIVKGQRVAILLHNRVDYLDLWFGLSRIGAIQLPLNTAYKSQQLLHTLKRAPVAAIVVEDALLPELAAMIDQVPALKAVIILGNVKPKFKYNYLFLNTILSTPHTPPPAIAISGADVGAIMNTSGTTGPSKGVLLSHAQQYILGRNIADDLALAASDIYYNCFPLFHNTAQAMITLPVLLVGATMVLTEKFSATRFWPDVRAHGCTAFYFIGEILRILLKSTTASDGAGTALRIGWGIGAAQNDFAEFQSRHDIALRSGYGSTEGNVGVYLPHDSPNLASVGRALPGFEVRVTDEDNDPLPAGTTGEILVRSSEPCTIMLGYDGDPAATVAAWKDLWFHTGDAGYLDAGGNLFFTGRIKDGIRVRGENVSAFEIEAAMAQVDGVLEVAAIAVPCELGGDEVKIVVVARVDSNLNAETLIVHAQQQLPKFAVPRYVEFVAALPKTETSKVRKNVLRETPFSPATWDRLNLQAKDHHV
jgi:crotonobetaine/carnitine-CoA ligase